MARARNEGQPKAAKAVAAPMSGRQPPKKLEQSDVRRAVADAKIGHCQYEIGDIQEPGLDIRVRGRSASWYLRARLGDDQRRWRIGDIDVDVLGAVEARKRAAAAKLKLKAGQDPRDYLLKLETKEEIIHHDKVLDGWKWDDGRDAFLAFIKRERREDTYKDYRRTLISPEAGDLKPFEGRLLKHITENDVKRLYDTISERAAIQAGHTLTIVRRCLSWCTARADSGITVSVGERVKPEILGSDLDDGDKLGRLPSVEEMADLFWEMAKGNNPMARLAGALIALTGQRIATARRARPGDFSAAQDGRTGIWTIPRPTLKVRKGRQAAPHIIPLPPVAWHVVQQAISMLPTGAVWLFPQARERRAGSGDGGHISHNTVRNALASGESKVGPHDNRRALATYGTQFAGLTKAEVTMVLDHGASDVTDRYILHDGTHLTWSVMRKWEAWLMGECERKQPVGETTVAPLFLMPPREGMPTPKVVEFRRMIVANQR